MEISAELSFWIGVIGTSVGVISLGVTVYQSAVMNERKKHQLDQKKKLSEIQYLLAGVGNLALAKVQAWHNQASLLPKPQDDKDLEMFRVHSNAKDDLMEVSSLVSALEGTIDLKFSATTQLLEKSIEQSKLNNELQKIGLENPTIKSNLPNDPEH